MSQPWGLSGPQFLGVYAAGIGLTIVIPLIFRQVIRRVPDCEMVRQLDPYEIGYLAGGRRRVAQMIVAEQVDSGALRVDGAGKLSEADRFARTGPYAGSLDRIEPAGMPDGLRASAICGKLESDPAIAEICRGLRADKFIISSGRMAALRLVTAVLMLALLITGILRLIEGASNHRPVGLLFVLILLSFFVGIFLLAHTLQPPSSTAGSTYLKRLRETQGSSPSLVAPGAAVAALAGEAVLLGVALDGFSGVPDEATRAALLAGMPSSSGGGGGGCGGGGCGGGCGGGGCGG